MVMILKVRVDLISTRIKLIKNNSLATQYRVNLLTRQAKILKEVNHKHQDAEFINHFIHRVNLWISLLMIWEKQAKSGYSR